ncbi:cytochrome P450 [Mycena amicta]|nr:cytochrome P450 [Mycena amicta]
MSSAVLGVLVATVVLWLTKVLISRGIALRAAIRSLRAPYGGIHLLNPFHTPALLIGPWFPRSPTIGAWKAKFAPYAHHGCTCIGAVTLRNAIPVFWFSDANSVKYITTESFIFQKDCGAYEPLNFYGKNLVGTEGAEWHRHRRIAKPAFNETGNAFVWKETIRVMNEWFAEIDAHEEPLVINAEENLTQATLLIISSAEFGRHASWHDDGAAPPGHTLAFRQAVFAAIEHLQTKYLTPPWLYSLSERVYVPFIGQVVRDTQTAYEALRTHMLELIGLARAWQIEGNVDASIEAGLLRNLVEANMNAPDDVDGNHELGQRTLTDDELLSNIFTFLLAGHETTAHTLVFAVGLLALYPDVQRKIHREALELWPDDGFSKLPYTLAVIRETLRLFPAIVRIAKMVRADATVPAYRFEMAATGDAVENVEEIVVSVPIGGQVMVDIRALHHNRGSLYIPGGWADDGLVIAMYWGRDADEFKPERFIDTESYRWPRDAFLAFSAGPRNCIGQRFALSEGVCMLACLVRTFELSVPERLRGASFAEQKASLLAWKPGITMQPTGCFVQLRRRTGNGVMN